MGLWLAVRLLLLCTCVGERHRHHTLYMQVAPLSQHSPFYLAAFSPVNETDKSSMRGLFASPYTTYIRYIIKLYTLNTHYCLSLASKHISVVYIAGLPCYIAKSLSVPRGGGPAGRVISQGSISSTLAGMPRPLILRPSQQVVHFKYIAIARFLNCI